MDQNIIEKAKSWGNNTYFSESDRSEIKKLLNDLPNSEDELTERFYQDLEFGTGGLRAPMGMGRNRMNRYNVRRATQALCQMVLKNFGGGSAVVSYD
jgi:phosphoglucomutase